MNYLERYTNGDYIAVWNDLQALGPSVRLTSYLPEAQAVAKETMRRVGRNCERLIARFQALGYNFGTYPDGSRRDFPLQPLTPPTDNMLSDCTELEDQAGPIPLSLRAFWQEVGTVDLVGMHPEWPIGLDPLVVDPPEGAVSYLNDFEGSDNTAGRFVGLAPDDLHKDNVSGGDPYGVRLPEPKADFLFLNEPHNMLFVPYLRFAILQWGGFPGLDGKELRFDQLIELVDGLEPF